MPYRKDDRDGLEPQEFPDADDAEAQDDTSPCPACRALIYDDSERCPACGHYIGRDESKPWWMVAGILLCLAMAIGWVVYG